MKYLVVASFLFSISPAVAAPVQSSNIFMIDGDTVDIEGERFRLVGYDTPETYKPKCGYERALGAEATQRARQLVREAGLVDLVILPGRDKYDRGLARLYVHGSEIGEILISEGLARPYGGGRRSSWCR